MREVRVELICQPRLGQGSRVVGAARIENDEKNHDELDTWSGVLVGPREDVIESLKVFGLYQVKLEKLVLSDAEIAEFVDEAVEEEE